MIDINSLEKVLIDFVKLLNCDQLEKFQKNLLKIIKVKNTEKTKNNICNYPRSKNRGLCKRRCFNSIHCIYHTKTNPDDHDDLPKRYLQNVNPEKLKIIHEPDNIPGEIQLESKQVDDILLQDNIPIGLLIDNNSLNKDLSEHNTPERLLFDDIPSKSLVPDKNILPGYNKKIPESNEVETVNDNIPKRLLNINFPDESSIPGENILPVQNRNEEIPKKKKKKTKRYIQEYKKLCIYYKENYEIKIDTDDTFYITTKLLFKDNLDYEKNKNKSKDEITKMLISFNKHLIGVEDEYLKTEKYSELISYLFTIVTAFVKDNYNDEQFLKTKKIIGINTI